MDVKASTPKVVVDQIDTVAQNQADTEVIVTITVEQKKDTGTTDQQAIKDEADKTDIVFLDIELTKQVGENAPQDIGSANNTVLTFYIPFSYKNKTAVEVYRCHNGTAAALTKLAAVPQNPVDGTYYLDTANNRIILYASKFSTYALAYNDKTPNTGDNTSMVYWLALAGATGLAAGLMIYRKRRYSRQS